MSTDTSLYHVINLNHTSEYESIQEHMISESYSGDIFKDGFIYDMDDIFHYTESTAHLFQSKDADIAYGLKELLNSYNAESTDDYWLSGWLLSDIIYNDMINNDRSIIFNAIYYFDCNGIEKGSILSGFNHYVKSRVITWNWSCIDSDKEHDPYQLRIIHNKKFIYRSTMDLTLLTNNIIRQTVYNNVYIAISTSDTIFKAIVLGLNVLDKQGIGFIKLPTKLTIAIMNILLYVSTISQCQIIITPWHTYLKISNINQSRYHESYSRLLNYMNISQEGNLYNEAVWTMDFLPELFGTTSYNYLNVKMKYFLEKWTTQYNDIIQPLNNEESIFYHEY